MGRMSHSFSLGCFLLFVLVLVFNVLSLGVQTLPWLWSV